MFELLNRDNPAIVVKIAALGDGGGDIDSQNTLEQRIAQSIEGIGLISIPDSITFPGDSNAQKALNINCRQNEHSRDTVKQALKGTDMLFLAINKVSKTTIDTTILFAEVAKELEILTLAIVDCPSPAKKRIETLADKVDSILVIPNEKLLEYNKRDAVLSGKMAYEMLVETIQNITESVTRPGFINVDFVDVKRVLAEMGAFMAATGIARGPDRAGKATQAALSSPGLEGIHLCDAQGLMIIVAADIDITFEEFAEVQNQITAFAGPTTIVVSGTILRSAIEDSFKVTVIASGIEMKRRNKIVLLSRPSNPLAST